MCGLASWIEHQLYLWNSIINLSVFNFKGDFPSPIASVAFSSQSYLRKFLNRRPRKRGEFRFLFLWSKINLTPLEALSRRVSCTINCQCFCQSTWKKQNSPCNPISVFTRSKHFVDNVRYVMKSRVLHLSKLSSIIYL